MRPEKPKRVDVNPAQSGLADLGSAFGGLAFGGLPAGPSAPSPADVPSSQKPIKTRKLGRVVLRKETAHRGGKIVIVVDQFPASTSLEQLESLTKGLRQALGTGGTVKDRQIEIQGNHPGQIREFLIRTGYDVAGI